MVSLKRIKKKDSIPQPPTHCKSLVSSFSSADWSDGLQFTLCYLLGFIQPLASETPDMLKIYN
ncbi:hypothetical protein C5167_007110 [Papaver somniferum]|uniref:Uncharacterized protein n=1 Tax=Papaver somniferum TaxID=3469 RepID=A0A4Y7JIN8_PAPSO|nr:hypothetical protein C5167_007110 [Papaver somniferum]